MWIRSLGLTDFRSYPQVEVDLSSGITTFVGSNGQGKTNLVEAIEFVATLGSHRVATDAPLVRTGADTAFIRCGVVTDDRDVLVELAVIPGKANRARLNKSPVPKTRDVLGIVRVVLFAPEDLALVKGDPSDRRAFLDDLLVQRTPRLSGVKADYERVLKQRNALLKSSAIAKRSVDSMLRTLEVWDEQLIEHGAVMLAARQALLDDIRDLAVTEYGAVSGDTRQHLGLSIVSSLGDVEPTADVAMWKQHLATAITDRRREEIARGVTLVGPHRDDVRLMLGEVPAKGYASHGESWSIALALRLAAFDLLRDDGIDPVLILDDVFAELDRSRRTRLAQKATEANQVLITAAVEEDVPRELQGARFMVARGEVTPA